MVTVDNIKILEKLQNHEDGEVFYVKEENKVYAWREKEKCFKEVDEKIASEGGLKMNLYDINKSIISQTEPLDEAKLNDLKDMINSILDKNYYLMYGQEISYFTLFKRETFIIQDPENPQQNLGEAVLDCLKAFDKIYSFEKLEDNVIEIWVHNSNNDLATVLYLFDYTDGVVYYE